MTIIGDIATGNTDTADVLFLAAAILFAIVAILAAVGTNYWTRVGEGDHHHQPRDVAGVLLAAGLACTAVALLIL